MIDLNEYSLEPQKVAKEPQTSNFGDGRTTFLLSKYQVMKQLSNRGFQIKNAIDWEKFVNGQ